MSRRERAMLVLGVIIAIGLVVYPLAYRISTEQTSIAAAARTPEPTRASASAAPAPTPTGTNVIPFTIPSPTEPDRSAFARWQAEATGYRGLIDRQFIFLCPPNGTFGPIWGTDIYTDDSSVCTAATHQGLITREKGGTVMIVMRKALKEYKGSTRNGVTTESFGAWEGSYEVVVP